MDALTSKIREIEAVVRARSVEAQARSRQRGDRYHKLGIAVTDDISLAGLHLSNYQVSDLFGTNI